MINDLVKLLDGKPAQLTLHLNACSNGQPKVWAVLNSDVFDLQSHGCTTADEAVEELIATVLECKATWG